MHLENKSIFQLLNIQHTHTHTHTLAVLITKCPSWLINWLSSSPCVGHDPICLQPCGWCWSVSVFATALSRVYLLILARVPEGREKMPERAAIFTSRPLPSLLPALPIRSRVCLCPVVPHVGRTRLQHISPCLHCLSSFLSLAVFISPPLSISLFLPLSLFSSLSIPLSLCSFLPTLSVFLSLPPSFSHSLSLFYLSFCPPLAVSLSALLHAHACLGSMLNHQVPASCPVSHATFSAPP